MTSLLTSEQQNALNECLGKIYPASGKSTYFRAYREEEDGLAVTLEFKHKYEIKIPYYEVEDFISEFTRVATGEEEILTAEGGAMVSGRQAAPGNVFSGSQPVPSKALRKRQQVIAIIGRGPLTHKALLKEMGMKEASLYYHTTALKKEGHIFLDKEGRYILNTAFIPGKAHISNAHRTPGMLPRQSSFYNNTEPGKGSVTEPGNGAPSNEEAGLGQLLMKRMEFHKNKYENLKKAMELIYND